jgi:hypothetical protein
MLNIFYVSDQKSILNHFDDTFEKQHVNIVGLSVSFCGAYYDL